MIATICLFAGAALVGALAGVIAAPKPILKLLTWLLSPNDPRRDELKAEYQAIPRLERPGWVVQQVEVCLREGGIRVMVQLTVSQIRGPKDSYGLASDGSVFTVKWSKGFDLTDRQRQELFEEVRTRLNAAREEAAGSTVWEPIGPGVKRIEVTGVVKRED